MVEKFCIKESILATRCQQNHHRFAANAMLPEQTAAREIEEYLTKITGGNFTIQSENAAGSTPLSIYVGNTQSARHAGVDGSTLASEEWRIKTQDGKARFFWSA